MSDELIQMGERTWEHITGRAVEAYDISAHFNPDHQGHPLIIGDPLREALAVAARAGADVALSKFAAAYADRCGEEVFDLLSRAAVGLDLHVVALEDGAWDCEPTEPKEAAL